ncbi:MAG: tetratricopeptide repeat protein [Acidobacteriota bacterium]
MTPAVPRERFQVGDLLLDVDGHLLSRSGELVPLPPKTFELFVELVRRAPGVVRRQELIDTVWPKEFVNDEALTQRVMLLRRALGDDPKAPRYIASVPRWGYRLAAPVERLADEVPVVRSGQPGSAVAGDTPPPGATMGSAGAVSSSSDVLRSVLSVTRRRLRILAVLLVALAAALLFISWRMIGWGGGRTITSLAVLPFTSAGDTRDVEYLSAGLSESLASALRPLPPLRKVIASSTMAHFAAPGVDPRQVGRELDVEAVLTGHVIQHGATLTLNTELVSVSNGRQLWGGHYVRTMADLVAVQEEIRDDMVRALRLRLSGEERERLSSRDTSSPAAYQLYLKGRFFWNKRTPQGFDDAIACFQGAIDEDPGYALAWVGLADCYALLGSPEMGIAVPREVFPKARAAAERALEFNDALAEAHASLGLVRWLFAWDRRGAERELRRAIELNPGYASAHQWYAELLAQDGRWAEADSEIRRAQELDPLSLVIGADLGLFEYYRRQYDVAVDDYRAVLAMEPGFVQGRLGLALTYVQLERCGDALRELEEAHRREPDSLPVEATLGFALARCGRPTEAERIADELTEVDRQSLRAAYAVAGVWVGLADRDRAFVWLDRAREERSGLLGSLRADPAFDPIRSDPRFPALLKRVGLEP